MGVAKVAATLTDRLLHEAVMATGLLEFIRRSYVLIKTGHVAIDPFRQLVIDFLKDKECFKKNEVRMLRRGGRGFRVQGLFD